MGYYSSFDIEIYDAKTNEEIYDTRPQILKKLEKDIGLDEGEIFEYIKWYDMQKDMVKFSQQFPDYYFKVIRTGEDITMWCNYFCNGKIQDGELTIQIAPFNTLLLQELVL